MSEHGDQLCDTNWSGRQTKPFQLAFPMPQHRIQTFILAFKEDPSEAILPLKGGTLATLMHLDMCLHTDQCVEKYKILKYRFPWPIKQEEGIH